MINIKPLFAYTKIIITGHQMMMMTIIRIDVCLFCFVFRVERKSWSKTKKNGKYFFSLTISLRVFNLLGLCSHFFFFFWLKLASRMGNILYYSIVEKNVLIILNISVKEYSEFLLITDDDDGNMNFNLISWILWRKKRKEKKNEKNVLLFEWPQCTLHAITSMMMMIFFFHSFQRKKERKL